MRNILAFETSCDDTAVAIINQRGQILADVIYSQIKEHAPYGGVVPEIGSRSHIEQIGPCTNLAFKKANLSPKDISLVAATFAPGLVGPLLVGAQFAKGFALSCSIPLVPVHHIEGHIFAGFSEEDFPDNLFLALIASGGHTAIYKCDEKFNITTLGQTLDDAAGEAFDKIGRALGLSYPAGKKIDELAKLGDAQRFSLPIAFSSSSSSDNPNFSFSGLKTAALKLVKDLDLTDKKSVADLCASLQEAICLALSQKIIKLALKENIKHIVIGGGVAANSRLRSMLLDMCLVRNIKLFLPENSICTDNAIMIGRAALAKNSLGANLLIDVKANLRIEDSCLLYKI